MRFADVGSTSPAQLRDIRDWNNHQAWVAFERKYDPLLRRCCRYLGLDERGTDDVCQLTWIEVARRIESFAYDPARSFRGWLWVVCLNKGRDYLRDDQKDGCYSLGEREDGPTVRQYQSQGADDPACELDEEEDPVSSLWRRRTQEVQAAVKARVLPHTWEAFWLLAVSDWDLHETVEALGISHASAYKAKARIARQLREEGLRRFGNAFTAVGSTGGREAV